MLLVAIALLEANLGRQLAYEQKREAPSFFFIDVQPDQREPFSRLVGDVSGVAPTVTPVVRARLAAIDGKPVTRELIDRRKRESPEKNWYLTREYMLTWASAPPPANAITRGAGGRPRKHRRAPRVGGGRSREVLRGRRRRDAHVRRAGRADRGRGDESSQDRWQSLSANFFMVLSPGSLDGAPTVYLATARVPADVETRLQDSVVAAFPNVTAIPLRSVLERVSEVLAQISFAVRFMALFSIAAGLVVMAGALAATRYQRLYESVILKTLGATRWAIARAFAVEYACLGAVAGVGGTALAAVLAWIVLRFVLDTPWTLEPEALILGVALTTFVSLAIGLLATVRLLGRKPLSVLRQE
jgi:putative ABC transport system permease protein